MATHKYNEGYKDAKAVTIDRTVATARHFYAIHVDKMRNNPVRNFVGRELEEEYLKGYSAAISEFERKDQTQVILY